ncbi:IS1 family transposase, partial [Escherichia coli]
RLGRKSLSFSRSVELHDKVIGHYLNIKHYQKVGVITSAWS